MSNKLVGTCKWFDAAKGFGFINEEGDPDTDLFVHYRSIQMDGYKRLVEGQQVTFSKIKSDKGYHAVEVEPAEVPA